MNMNYSNLTIMYEVFLAQMYVLLVLFTIFAFYHENLLSQNCKKYFLPEICIFGQKKTLKHCSQRTVVHVYVNAFL